MIMASLVWSNDKRSSIASDTNRCINLNCSVDCNWSAKGRVYTECFVVTKESGKAKYIKQSRLCDIGILD